MSVTWGITGAGHFLRECVNLILELTEVDVFLSHVAEQVLWTYRLEDDLRQATEAVVENTARLCEFPGFTVVKNIEGLRKCLNIYL